VTWLCALLVLLLALAPRQTEVEESIEKARSLVAEGRGLDAIEGLVEASRTTPGSGALHHELGMLYASAKRERQALSELGRACELSDEPTFALDYGELLYRTGRAADALIPLEKASSLPGALLLLAGAHEKLGDEESAITALTRYLEAKPDEIGARLLLGGKLEQAKRFEDAIAVYRAGLGLGVGTKKSDAPLLGRIAELSSRNRETYAEAEDAAKRASAADPHLLDPRIVLARVLSRTDRDKEAIDELELAREDHPEASEIYYGLAQAYQRTGRNEEARTAAETFQKLSAKEKGAREREARIAVTYKRALELLQHGDMIEAAKGFQSVLEIDADHAQSKSMLAKIAFSRNDVSAAERWIDEAIATAPEVAEYHYLRALFQAKSGEPDVARASLRRSLELDPASSDSWSLLGTLLTDAHRAEEAVRCFERAAALDPTSATIQLNLASAYAALGNRAGEESAMERYRRLSERR
jgi:tetratricopeptide (TPR) repeat protein